VNRGIVISEYIEFPCLKEIQYEQQSANSKGVIGSLSRRVENTMVYVEVVNEKDH
jgi:hypothetical protein